MKNNIILAFIGTSGVGKTALMRELLLQRPDQFLVLKTLASRARRGPEDDLFYEFVSADLIREKNARGELAQYVEFAGNLYACARADIDSALAKGVGIQAYVESAIFDLRKQGYEVLPIKIVADIEVFRADDRLELDKEREKIDVGIKLVVVNSFKEGGLQKAVDQIVAFVDSL